LAAKEQCFPVSIDLHSTLIDCGWMHGTLGEYDIGGGSCVTVRYDTVLAIVQKLKAESRNEIKNACAVFLKFTNRKSCNK